ncbi:MAG TPA: hypothetical protein VNI77_10265 [Nitrososphaera sp.]|nr:hypothetical protein [Nitrososphaera sp.]
MSVAFSTIIDDFRLNVERNREVLRAALKRSPQLAYQKVNELALFVGSRYNVNLQLHFPEPAKISDIGSYGVENVGIVVDKWRKTFPVPREMVKQKAAELIGSNVKPQDAYMYEGKEGVRIVMPEGRIEVLPGSVHFWCTIDEKVRAYADWLAENVYFTVTKKT